MANHHVPAVTIEARRALVAEAVAKRTPYRQIAERLGVSFGTVAGDVEALRKDWRKSYGDLGGLLTQTAMDLDRWQARMESNLNALAADELPPALAALIRISDQRNKLFGLYPKTGAEAEAMPTGPIVVELKLIPGGNSQLVTNSKEYDDDEEPDIIEAGSRKLVNQELYEQENMPGHGGASASRPPRARQENLTRPSR